MKALKKILAGILVAGMVLTIPVYADDSLYTVNSENMSGSSYTNSDFDTVSAKIETVLSEKYEDWAASNPDADCYKLTKWVQDQVFGNAPTKKIKEFNSVSQLRVGDIVGGTYNLDTFWIVTEIGINYAEMTSGGSSYYFTDRFSKDEIAKNFREQFTRYTDDAVVNDNPKYSQFSIDLNYTGTELMKHPTKKMYDHFIATPYVSLYAYIGDYGEEAVIPNIVEDIESSAFSVLYDRKFPEVLKIPDSVILVGNRAFEGQGISEIYYYGKNEQEWYKLTGTHSGGDFATVHYNYVLEPIGKLHDITNTSANYCGAAFVEVDGDAEVLSKADSDVLYDEDVSLSLTVKQKDASSIGAETVPAISGVIGSGKVGQYLDITITKYIGGKEAGSIAETGKPVKIRMELPDGLAKTDNSKARDYIAICVHDGRAEVLDTDFDGTYLTFSTDKFSDYAIAYLDLDYGDVNGDGNVNMADLLLLKQYMVKVPGKSVYKSAADVTADNNLE